MKDLELELSAPVYTYANTVQALFEEDQEIEIEELVKTDIKGEYLLKIKCSNPLKGAALSALLRKEVVFGKLKLITEVDTSDAKVETKDLLNMLNLVFAGNPLFSQAIDEIDSRFKTHKIWCLMQPEILQFYNDDLSDYYRNLNISARDAAKLVCDDSLKIHFSAEQKE